jgi:Zn-dependent peptidase ImmA (M78 family)/transcriptional regulator with XRE-family HTH domain
MTFNPKMLTLAREAAGLTQGVVAAECGVSQALMSKIEHGLERPTEDLMRRVAEACEVPLPFLHQQEALLGEGLVDFFHKKRLTLPAKPLRRANALANVTRLETMHLMRTLELTDVAPFPSFPLDEYGSIEEIAQMVRATWRIPPGPLPDLVAILEAAAVPIFTLSLGHEKLSAISMPGVEAGGHIIILNRDLPASALRFALAHELGHLVMHQGVATSDMEREADEFASALLMPASDISQSLRNVRFRDLGGLKTVWRVSLAALIYRAHQLGAISDRHYRTLNIQLNQLPGGRKREPGESEPEQPRLIRYVIEHYEKELDYNFRDIEDLMVTTESSLRSKYFGEPERHLRSIGGAKVTHQLSVMRSNQE